MVFENGGSEGGFDKLHTVWTPGPHEWRWFFRNPCQERLSDGPRRSEEHALCIIVLVVKGPRTQQSEGDWELLQSIASDSSSSELGSRGTIIANPCVLHDERLPRLGKQ